MPLFSNSREVLIRLGKNMGFTIFLFFSNDGTESPVQQNPAVDIGALNVPMRLAINTAQYGRIFEDRSHVFEILPRPATIQVTELC